MEELINPVQAEWLVALISATLLVAGAVARGVGRDRWVSRVGRRGAILGVAAGPALYLLWQIDAALISLMGFDSLRRAIVEGAIFAALGLALGAWLRMAKREQN